MLDALGRDTSRENHGTGGGGESRRCPRSFAEENFYEPHPGL
jgi:hypothetical protein